MECTAAVIGGGIVGLAVARRVAETCPGVRVVLLEKEADLALHQTGRNSGVIHSGIYYKPGSLKARTCTHGRRLLLDFCAQHNVAHELCGKVIVATSDAQVPQLRMLEERGKANGVRAAWLSAEALKEREPAAAGVAALQVDDTGIADYVAMCRALAACIRAAGGEVRLNARVDALRRVGGAGGASAGGAGAGAGSAGAGVELAGPWGQLRADVVLNCAGLHCDRVARAAGAQPSARIVPFRGEYYRLRPDAPPLCRHLIYPVPDPSFPFLGVHLTRMVDGSVECGPNAVLALGREAYTWGQFNLRDAAETAAFGGFWKLAARHWRAGLGEVHRSLSRAAFVKALQQLVPGVRAEHLEPAPAGIRAQAMEPSGALVDDFRVQVEPPYVHVLNAPSPAATASLAIAEAVVAQAQDAGLLRRE